MTIKVKNTIANLVANSRASTDPDQPGAQEDYFRQRNPPRALQRPTPQGPSREQIVQLLPAQSIDAAINVSLSAQKPPSALRQNGSHGLAQSNLQSYQQLRPAKQETAPYPYQVSDAAPQHS